MMRSNSPGIDAAIEKAVNYEVTVADLVRRSERRAWRVASAATLMALILAGGCFYMLPLKEKVPFLIMADAYSGNATVARLREDYSSNSITGSEALKRANVATFIRARESYDSTLIGDRDWNTVFTMAAPEVNSGYRVLHAATNPNAPAKLFGTQQAIRIRILSLQLFGGKPGTKLAGANVRFQRSLFDKSSGKTRFLDNKIATLEYTYKPNLEMSEEMRTLNPLGFQVTAYRVDNDYATTPAMDDESASLVAQTTGTRPGEAPQTVVTDTESGPQPATPIEGAGSR